MFHVPDYAPSDGKPQTGLRWLSSLSLSLYYKACYLTEASVWLKLSFFLDSLQAGVNQIRMIILIFICLVAFSRGDKKIEMELIIDYLAIDLLCRGKYNN